MGLSEPVPSSAENEWLDDARTTWDPEQTLSLTREPPGTQSRDSRAVRKVIVLEAVNKVRKVSQSLNSSLIYVNIRWQVRKGDERFWVSTTGPSWSSLSSIRVKAVAGAPLSQIHNR